MSVTLLDALLVEEVSLVDAAANGSAGWLVLKALSPPAGLAVIAKADDKRIASTVVYQALPHIDQHGEGASAEQLYESFLRFALTKGNKRLNLQHDTTRAAGEITALVGWGQKRASKLCVPNAACKSESFTAGSIFAVTRFNAAAWRLLKSADTLGLSLGGRARRTPGTATAATTEMPTWVWSSEPQLLTLLKAAELPEVAPGLFDVPRKLDARSRETVWDVSMNLRFLDASTG